MGDQVSRAALDVNRDGATNILDLILIAQDLGKSVSPGSQTDVNGDGTVNILDLITVAQHLEGAIVSSASSPTTINFRELDPVMIQTWIQRAQIEDDGSIVFQQGMANLQKLWVSLIPTQTSLMQNYPNPFNPETWIPYQLVEPSEVRIGIYNVKGSLVWELDLGHQQEGYYTSRSRAAYWDGRNNLGESVVSGVYFSTLTAGDFSATRKMLIRK